jgi:hypothetical protein
MWVGPVYRSAQRLVHVCTLRTLIRACLNTRTCRGRARGYASGYVRSFVHVSVCTLAYESASIRPHARKLAVNERTERLRNLVGAPQQAGNEVAEAATRYCPSHSCGRRATVTSRPPLCALQVRPKEGVFASCGKPMHHIAPGGVSRRAKQPIRSHNARHTAHGRAQAAADPKLQSLLPELRVGPRGVRAPPSRHT